MKNEMQMPSAAKESSGTAALKSLEPPVGCLSSFVSRSKLVGRDANVLPHTELFTHAQERAWKGAREKNCNWIRNRFVCVDCSTVPVVFAGTNGAARQSVDAAPAHRHTQSSPTLSSAGANARNDTYCEGHLSTGYFYNPSWDANYRLPFNSLNLLDFQWTKSFGWAHISKRNKMQSDSERGGMGKKSRWMWQLFDCALQTNNNVVRSNRDGARSAQQRFNRSLSEVAGGERRSTLAGCLSIGILKLEP